MNSNASASRTVLTTTDEPLTAQSGEVLRTRREEAVAGVVKLNLLNDISPLCGVLDLDTLDELMASLMDAYPADLPAMHTIAAKSVTLQPVLARYAQAGFGCEVASSGELELALAAGFMPEKIVFDSPAKTEKEILRALELGVAFNLDNFQELARVDRLRRPDHQSSIGFRINPQTGAGTIGPMSTATATSKFGVGLLDYRNELVEAYAARPWLNQLHVHSGSQGLTLEHAALGVKSIVELARDINERAGRRQVNRIDIGGGLPVNFDSDDVTPGFDEHRKCYEQVVPELFNGDFLIITEFGRALTAKAGVVVTRVEYDKVTGGRRIAVTHAGVQVASRTVYMPEMWPLRVEVYDQHGLAKTGETDIHDIAGPACFSGDMIAVGRQLPIISATDIIAIPDTGGYYFSSHFSYNALQRPGVYAISSDNRGIRRWSLIRRPQTLEEIVSEAGETTFQPLDA